MILDFSKSLGCASVTNNYFDTISSEKLVKSPSSRSRIPQFLITEFHFRNHGNRNQKHIDS